MVGGSLRRWQQGIRRAGATASVGQPRGSTAIGGNGVHSCQINDGRGSAYLHLDDPRLPADAYDSISAPRVEMTAVEVFPADHRRVVQGLIAHYGAGLAEGPDVIQGRFPDGKRLTVGFTEEGLVKAITSENVRS